MVHVLRCFLEDRFGDAIVVPQYNTGAQRAERWRNKANISRKRRRQVETVGTERHLGHAFSTDLWGDLYRISVDIRHFDGTPDLLFVPIHDQVHRTKGRLDLLDLKPLSICFDIAMDDKIHGTV